MADPVFNEQYILKMLDVPVGLASIDRLQTATMLTIVDGFDRKLKREAFVRLIANALSAHANLGRLQFIKLLMDLHTQHPVTLEQLVMASTEMVAYCETERVSLVKQFQLVAQCPTSLNKIH